MNIRDKVLIMCAEPNFSSCNYTSTKECRYFTICEKVSYNQVACSCPKWWKSSDDIDYYKLIKLVYKSFPNCPFCGDYLKEYTTSRIGFETGCGENRGR